jgi:hypothetical protein
MSGLAARKNTLIQARAKRSGATALRPFAASAVLEFNAENRDKFEREARPGAGCVQLQPGAPQRYNNYGLERAMVNSRIYRRMLDDLELFEKEKLDWHDFMVRLITYAHALEGDEGRIISQKIMKFEGMLDTGCWDKDFRGMETIREFIKGLESKAEAGGDDSAM